MSIVLVEKNREIASITLNRPEYQNAINLDMAIMLDEVAREISLDPAIQVVIVRGAGRAFCAGGDIFSFAQHFDDLSSYIRQLLTAHHRFLTQIARMPKLTIASVHGSAAGAGMSLAAMCDMCVAEEGAKFVPAYAKLGVSPDGGGTFGLGRAVGPRRALKLFLADRAFSAKEAETWGLVTKLAAADQLDMETRKLAEQLVATGEDAVSNTKRLLGKLQNGDLDDQLSDEMESLLRCMDTARFQNSIREFVASSLGQAS